MQTALVTGANRGIGLATARRLARSCGHVILSCRDTAAGEEAVDRLSREGGSVSNLTMDVTDASQVRAAAAYVAERFGHLDILVKNAGIVPEATNKDPKEVVDLSMFEQTSPPTSSGRCSSPRRSSLSCARAGPGGS